MLVLVPHGILGQEIPNQPRTGGAIFRTQGGVWVNGYEAQDSSAVFPGDVIETKNGFSASLTVEGSTVLLSPQSLGKFGDNFIVLEHGGVSVGTSRKFEVRVNCMKVVPVLAEWTQYEVNDVNRTVQVAARKDDVNVEREGGRVKASQGTEAEQRASVHEGEQRGYDENEVCGAPPAPTQAGAINAKWIEIGAGAAGGGVLCALLCRGGGGSKPSMSQSAP